MPAPARPPRLPTKKKKPTNATRKAYAPAQPLSIERSYARAIRAMVNETRSTVLRALEPVMKKIAAENGSAERTDSSDWDFAIVVDNGLRTDALPGVELFNRAFSRTRVKTTAAEHGKKTIKHVDQQLKTIFKIPIGEDLPKGTLERFTKKNVALIESIPKRLHREVGAVLQQAQKTAWRVERIQDEIEARFDVSESRAELIARDQVLKLNGQTTRTRHEQAGIEEYIWTTVGPTESRVRAMHRELEGKRFRYDDPPVTNEDGDTNNPGEDYQCRCIAYPVIPELDDVDADAED